MVRSAKALGVYLTILPGVLEVIGSSVAFDTIGGDNGLSIAALQPAGATQSMLYLVNLGSGALTAIGGTGSATTVIKALSMRLQ